MPSALIPKNELERLIALGRYSILDTPAESEFDDLTFLPSQICRTPVSRITLLALSRKAMQQMELIRSGLREKELLEQISRRRLLGRP